MEPVKVKKGYHFWLNHPIINNVAAPIVIVVSLLLFVFNWKWDYPQIVKDELSNAGFDVEDIEFLETDSGGGFGSNRVFHSSQPIEYLPGQFVSEWELYDIYAYSTTITEYHVRPYPQLPELITVNKNIEMSKKEMDILAQLAGDTDVEEYIMDIVRQHIEDAATP